MTTAAAAVSLLTITLTIALVALATGQPLRNVIITSFGELPYEPAEQGGGYYQSDVYPVSLNGNDPPQTMDVALRTGILVEDPNEQKNDNSEPKTSGEEEEDKSATNTNAKRQAASTNGKFELDEEDFLIPRSKVERNSKVYGSRPVPSFGYEFRQTKKVNDPFTPRTVSNGYNINTEYYGDLGLGWDLEDAEELLQGRNYNVLVRADGYPTLPPRETPPPPVVGRHFPNYNPYPDPTRRVDSLWPHPRLWPYPRPVYYSDSDSDSGVQ